MRSLLLLMLISVAGRSQQIKITVKLNGLANGNMYYLKDGDNKTLDSSTSKNERLAFDYLPHSALPVNLNIVSIDQAAFFRVWIDNAGPVSFWGNAGEKSTLAAKGSRLQNEFKLYMDQIIPLEDSISRMKKRGFGLRNVSKAKADSAENEWLQLRKEVTAKEINFIKDHPNSNWSAYVIMMESARKNFSKEQTVSAFQLLHTDVQNSPWGSDIVKILQSKQDVIIGKAAPDFTAQDNKGRSISLTDFIGRKVVLVFWASWCAPCRAEIPNIRKAYEKHKSDNFTFISVSVDEKEEEWKLADKKEGLEWKSLWQPGGWLSSPALAYSVTSLPKIFLIDERGVVIEKDPILENMGN